MPSWDARGSVIGSKITKNISKPVQWTKVFVWCGIIFAISSVPNHSGQVIDFNSIAGIADFLGRKFSHFAEYFVLMVLMYNAVRGSRPRPHEGHLLACFGFILLFAVSDEWHQTFVFGRNGSGFDVFVDCAGAFAGYIWKFRKDPETLNEKEIPH